ncbi:MAG: methionine synthase [Planctomycetota bacterium]
MLYAQSPMLMMDFNFLPTGIGSFPHTDAKESTGLVLKYFDKIPFWPQLPQRSFLEGMATQFSEGLPNFIINPEKKTFYIDTEISQLDKGVTAFYEKYLAGDLSNFAISKEYAAGFYEIIHQVKSKRLAPSYIKGQITGPVTFGALITDESGKAIMHHPLLSDVLIKCLIMKARWQIKSITNLGLKSIIFLDEPYLMGYGSAYIPLTREIVVKQLTEVINEIHKEDVLVGIHCCGNTDWSVILETPIDILNFDAFGFMDKLLLYSDKLNEYINRGGIIAWGIVPSIMMDNAPSVEDMVSRLKNGIETMAKRGVDKERLIKQSILTPSCGLGGLSETQAEERLKLLIDTFKALPRIRHIKPA